MAKPSRAADHVRESERKHGPAPAVGLKPRAKTKAKRKTKTRARRKAPEAEVVEAELMGEPEPETVGLEDAWASLRDRFSPETQAIVDKLQVSGFSREDLITLELAIGLELQTDIKAAKGKAKALLTNTFMQSRKNLRALVEKQGTRKKADPVVRVPVGMRDLKPLALPDPGREVDDRPKDSEVPERYK
jgi:hypothetical protein